MAALIQKFEEARFHPEIFADIAALREKKEYVMLCIKAYEQYMGRRIRGIDIIHVKSYIYRVSCIFKKSRENESLGWFARFIRNLGLKWRRYHSEEWGSELIEKDYKQDPRLKSRFNRHRLGLFKSAFYVFLFAVDGAYWGRLILSPIFEKFPFLETLSNVTLVDYLLSPSSSWADLWAVLFFHTLSFFAVLLFSRLPTRLAFYYKMLHFVRSDECKNIFKSKTQDFPFRGTSFIIEKFARFVAAKPQFYYFLTISLYYGLLSFLPYFFELGDPKVMVPINLLFWIILHFSYLWFGEVSFILKEELRRHIEKFEFDIPDEIEKLEEHLRNEFAKERAKKEEVLIDHLLELGQRFESGKKEAEARLKPLLDLRAQEQQKRQELTKMKALMQDLNHTVAVYQNKIVEIGKKITVDDPDTICNINFEEVKNAIIL